MSHRSWGPHARAGAGLAALLGVGLAAGCGAEAADSGAPLPTESATESAAALSGDTSCKHVGGVVMLLPEPAGKCTISTKLPGPTYVGNPDPTGNPACFRVFVFGSLNGSGYAGLTAEALQFGGTATPATLHEWPAPPTLPTRLVLTARSALKFSGGSIQTRDTNLIDTATGTITEQIMITGGDGAYAGATGALVILGDSLGKPAPITGRICVPRS
ncbi:MAG: hypothetical protein IPL40_08310 [Proteobacteria bacterium]|nr:hypothetical protein [Pseudomonadota bacterium]